MGKWTLDDIPWDRFDPAKVDPDLVPIVKAAGLVEHNGRAYAHHLCLVFADDSEFQQTARRWGEEEVQHGRRWRAGRRWPIRNSISTPPSPASGKASASISTATARGAVRGPARWWRAASSKSAPAPITPRCATPLASRYCRRSAAISPPTNCGITGCSTRTSTAIWRRTGSGAWAGCASRSAASPKSDDDELAYAYYAANETGRPYDRRRCNRAYARRVYALYRPHHVERGVAMLLKAAGLTPNGRLGILASRLAWRAMRYRAAGSPRQRHSAGRAQLMLDRKRAGCPQSAEAGIPPEFLPAIWTHGAA